MAQSGDVGINREAPVLGACEIEIDASPEEVWDVLTGFERWPDWNRDVKSVRVEGPVAAGMVFRWKAGPGTITSTIVESSPPRVIGWTGRTLGIHAIHFWHLESKGERTLVRTEESYDGLMTRVFRARLQKTVDDALADGLDYLKAEVERRPTG